MMVQTFPSRQSSPEQITQAQFENYKRCTTAQIPNTIDKLNKRLIMSREANHVRATTMAMTKIYAKERKRKLYKVPKDTWTLEPSQTFQDTMKGAKIGLRSSLETKLVDKLAAAEIETTKHVDLDSYPKLSNEQIEGKLTRLRIHAESGFKPLEFARSMELIHLSNKRIRSKDMDDTRKNLPVIKIRVESQGLKQNLGLGEVHSVTISPIGSRFPPLESPFRKAGHKRLSPVRLSIENVQQPDLWIPNMRPGAKKKAKSRNDSSKHDSGLWVKEGSSGLMEYQPQFPGAKINLREFRGRKRSGPPGLKSSFLVDSSPTRVLNSVRPIGMKYHLRTRSISPPQPPPDTLQMALTMGLQLRSAKLKKLVLW